MLHAQVRMQLQTAFLVMLKEKKKKKKRKLSPNFLWRSDWTKKGKKNAATTLTQRLLLFEAKKIKNSSVIFQGNVLLVLASWETRSVFPYLFLNERELLLIYPTLQSSWDHSITDEEVATCTTALPCSSGWFQGNLSFESNCSFSSTTSFYKSSEISRLLSITWENILKRRKRKSTN